MKKIKICTPVIGKTLEEFLNNLDQVQGVSDIVELRVDKIKNLSNVYVREVPVEIKLPGINLSLSSVKIELLAPYERKEINLELKIDKSKKINKTDFQIIVFGKKLFEQQIKIVSPIYEFLLKIGGSLIIITFVYLLLKNRRK